MAKFVNYLDKAKQLDKKGDTGRRVQAIAQRMQDSRKAGGKDPLAHIPKHVKVLQAALKDLNALKKDKKTDKKDLKLVDELIKQVQSDLKLLSTPPKSIKK